MNSLEIKGRTIEWISVPKHHNFSICSSFVFSIKGEGIHEITNQMHSFDGYGEVGSLIINPFSSREELNQITKMDTFDVLKIRLFKIDKGGDSVVNGIEFISHSGRNICIFSHVLSGMLSILSSELDSRLNAENDIFCLKQQIL